MLIVSVPGRLVRDPVTSRPVDTTPIEIDPTDPYWARLLADGDVAEPLTELVAPLVDSAGARVDPPAGDIAADIEAPGAITPSSKGSKA